MAAAESSGVRRCEPGTAMRSPLRRRTCAGWSSTGRGWAAIAKALGCERKEAAFGVPG